MTILSLLDDAGLTTAERADVISGRNTIDITEKFSALLVTAETTVPGAVVDATMWRGVVHWTRNPFATVSGSNVVAMPSLRATLKTGPVTFTKNFNDGPIFLPSNFRWDMDGTVFRPSVPITSILTNASPASGMLMTFVAGLNCSAVDNASSITLTYSGQAADVAPGAMIAIEGIEAYPAVELALGETITPATTSFTLTPASTARDTIGGSFVYLKIGSEIIRGLATYNSGTNTTTIDTAPAPGARGALGTSAADHIIGDPVTLMKSAIHRVRNVTVSGGVATVELSGTIPSGFTGGIARVGAFGTRLSGAFTIDGEYVPEASGVQSFLCLASTLSAGLSVDGSARLRNASHGGLMLMACADADIEGYSIVDCGRPAVNFGSAVWGFGGGRRNRVAFDLISGGYAGLLSDNKSFGVPGFGTIDGESDCIYQFGRVANLEHLVDFTGTSRNMLTVDRMESGIAMPTFENALSSGQTTSAVPAQGNVVLINSTEVSPAKGGTNAALNTVVVEGAAV